VDPSIESPSQEARVGVGLAEQAIRSKSLDLDPKWGSAKTLAPAIARLLGEQGLSASHLGAVAVLQGPGSFTGLRVGIATAKALSYAVGIPIVALDTLDVIAEQIRDTRSVGSPRCELIAVVDAFRGQSFCATYRIEEGVCHKTVPTRIVDNEILAGEILRCRNARERLVAGPSLGKLRESFQELVGRSETNCEDTLAIRWVDSGPKAATLAQLGWQGWIAGRTSDAFGLLPNYYRSSAAEEKSGKVSG
jgi:tRNA threonylcarbamoyladenosine biosynthesis protein TsaB